MTMAHVDHGFEIMETQDHSSELGHVQPFKVYAGVFGALLLLTVVTVVASFMDFGNFDFAVAMLIASVKAMLVALYFMHLKYENPFTWVYAGVPILFLIFLVAGVFLDNPTRNEFEKTGSALKQSTVEVVGH
jgi:cytochrome c oxidase subunit IV